MKPKHYPHLLLAIASLSIGPAGSQEQLVQDPIVIKGERGLPGTLYIVPWKRVSEPLDSGALELEIGEETEPLERDLFLRELELQRQGYSIGNPSQPHTRASPAGEP